ncbi:unnamed protein product [Gadus morhua 'NCC']
MLHARSSPDMDTFQCQLCHQTGGYPELTALMQSQQPSVVKYCAVGLGGPALSSARQVWKNQGKEQRSRTILSTLWGPSGPLLCSEGPWVPPRWAGVPRGPWFPPRWAGVPPDGMGVLT